jgi:hypothetical protein
MNRTTGSSLDLEAQFAALAEEARQAIDAIGTDWAEFDRLTAEYSPRLNQLLLDARAARALGAAMEDRWEAEALEIHAGDKVIWSQTPPGRAGQFIPRPATVMDVVGGKVRIITTDDYKPHTVKCHNVKKVRPGVN